MDQDRQRRLEQELGEAEAAIAKLLVESVEPATAKALRDRVAAIREELDRMEFAVEIERQSDA